MQDDSLVIMVSVAIIGLVSLGVGTVIGFILAGMRGQPAAGKDSPGRKGLVEMARIWRDQRSGRVSIELDGAVYHTQSELKPRQRETLNGVHDELNSWLGIADQPSRSAPAAPPAGAAQPPVIASTARVSRPAPVVSTLKSQPPIGAGSDVRPPSMEVGDILARAFVTEVPKDNSPLSKSIAMQVDEIIQERLPESPYRGRAISLRDLSAGGIVVLVDDKKYAGVSEVADPGVRAFLQSCVAEWERRTSGD